jgi:hypothetical protein
LAETGTYSYVMKLAGVTIQEGTVVVPAAMGNYTFTPKINNVAQDAKKFVLAVTSVTEIAVQSGTIEVVVADNKVDAVKTELVTKQVITQAAANAISNLSDLVTATAAIAAPTVTLQTVAEENADSSLSPVELIEKVQGTWYLIDPDTFKNTFFQNATPWIDEAYAWYADKREVTETKMVISNGIYTGTQSVTLHRWEKPGDISDANWQDWIDEVDAADDYEAPAGHPDAEYEEIPQTYTETGTVTYSVESGTLKVTIERVVEAPQTMVGPATLELEIQFNEGGTITLLGEDVADVLCGSGNVWEE